MSFPQFVLNPAAITLSGLSQSTWSGAIASGAPAGATGMLCAVAGPNGSVVRELRKNGSTDNYTSDGGVAVGSLVYRFVGLDSSGQFNYFSASTTPNSDTIYPIAYFGSEAVFPTNIIAMGSTLTTSYATYSTGGNAPGAIAAVFAIHGGSDFNSYFRHPSSTDSFASVNESTTTRHWLCALDGSQEYAGKAGTAGRQPYLVAYFTNGYSPNTNVVDRTPGTFGSYQNISSSGDTSPVGIAYHGYCSSTAALLQISEQTSTWSAPDDNIAGKFSANVFAGAPVQANLASANIALKELGYFFVPTNTNGGRLGLLGVGS